MVAVFEALSPRSREVAAATIRQLAEAEGIAVSESPRWLGAPVDGVPMWVAKLKGEGKSPRTAALYEYLARRYLGQDPRPTGLSVQGFLAKELEGKSAAFASNEQKALKSLFSFLQEEGLWPSNPIARIKHIRVKYSNRPPPEVGDVLKVLGGRLLRRADTDKLVMLVLLLGTTGLRVSEAAGVLRRDVALGRGEVYVVGKGDKPRTVPLLPVTARALEAYMARHPSGRFLFPNRAGDGPACIQNIEKTLRRACLRVGVDPFTPHGLRHFFATEALRDGAKLEVVSRILGHSSVGVTGDVYRHVKMGEMRDEVLTHAPLNGVRALPPGGPGEEK